ncbi:MAG: HEXXH motif-containing putative peptide modification protein [Nitrospira sp.]|nr:HEXXH motif-containing putative peptide modification protein [Nitrospira sp.]
MRRLLTDLCRELHADHADLAQECRLPTGFFASLRSSFALETYANWKVVGWIETLNDLVYFLDVLKQWRLERDRADFTAQLVDECQEKFFEHGYVDDLFPAGKEQVNGFDKRLLDLCRRLASELTQESLWFDPVVPVTWCRQRKMTQWEVCGNLKENFEKAELAGTVSVDTTGARCQAPSEVRRALRQSSGRVVFRVEPTGITVNVGKIVSPIWSSLEEDGQWQWACHPPIVAIQSDHDPVTVGPTLVYGKDRQPRTVKSTDRRQVDRIARAWQAIQIAWPEGHAVLALLTARIVPLQAKGVVSFSYRHRPGLSFINCFDRGNLDLIDDLIHENSHHHLNLLLRKYVMYRGDHNQQIFYSPWRRSLRPLRGILHATFTFTMGALLFQRLSSWASGRGGAVRWKRAGLTRGDQQRARFRCLEEVESVRYSLHDLHYADHHLGWLTGSGRGLVGQLAEAIDQVERESKQFRGDVERSQFGPALRKHIKGLQQARQTYGPVQLSKA